MSKQNKAPRWEDVPEEARGAARQAMSLIRDTAPPGDKVRAAIDAALARLAEPAQPSACQECGDAILSNGSRYVRKSTGALLCIECAACAASEPAPSEPTAAERWRAVSRSAAAMDLVARLTEEAAAYKASGEQHEADALVRLMLLALAREAEGT